MRNLKKILALVLALVMALSVMTVANAFTDDESINDTYAEAVDVLNGMGVFQGYENGSFQPQGKITRAEVAAIIYRIDTGDVDDRQVALYSDYAAFTDIGEAKWAAGYIGYCANAEFIKGYGDGTFGPNDPVTGYQALAMILRAVGYDKNGEFTGSGWQVQTAKIAKDLGITNNVIPGTLGTAATREVVAEILFRAIQVPQVEYTLAFGYQPVKVLSQRDTINSLGWENFGLWSTYGYITGNQATGEACTKLGATPVDAAPLYLNTTTGLDVFGHYTKVWYNADQTYANTVYASYDLGASETVTKDEYDVLTNKAEYFSNSYGTIDTVSKVWDYNVLVTNPGTANDVLVRLNLDIAQYVAINNYVTVPYLTVKSGAANGAQITIALADATGYEGIALGSYVNVLTVTGTNLPAGKTFFEKQISALTGFTGASVKYIAKDLTVTLTDGTTVKSSSETHKRYAANVNPYMDIRGGWSFGTVYNIYTDMFGNYVGAIPQSDDAYAKLTYAWYETVVSTGEISYYAQAVRNDGTIETVKLALTADEYDKLTCSRLDWANNKVVVKGDSMDVVLTPAANGYAIAHKVYDVHNGTSCGGFIADVVGNVGLTTVGRLNSASWVVTKNTTTMTSNKNYFVDASTKFVVVSGFGGTLTVDSYTLAELVGDNLQVEIPMDSIVTATKVYSANIYSNNYHIDYVLIENPVATPVSDLIYIESATPVGTSAAGFVYDVFFNGQPDQVTVSAVAGVAINDQTFYTYKLVNGVYVLQAPAAPNGCLEDRQVTVNKGTAYLYVQDTLGNQKVITEAATIIDLTGDAAKVITANDLIVAAENNVITVDVEIVSEAITVVYIVGYNVLIEQ